MARLTVVALFSLFLSVQAFAKPKDTYPVSCPDLWDAVQNTLANAGDYKVLAQDDDAMTASFLAVGAQRQRVNSLSLSPKDSGCRLQLQFPDSGFSDDEEGLFRKRVDRSLANRKAAKPSGPSAPKN